ncbi:M14 family metallopeptidase [Brevibacillus sp. B_LB10_24]|uniref:M14 family metallopeptidase n=1 Tax=Brevibacillus sp. B_LB10_24 TaxID=3380645 RepID=UPI0038B8F573
MGERIIAIGNLAAKPGFYAKGNVEVARLSNGSAVYLPVHIVNGREPGPVLWVNGAVHGDELNVPFALLKLLPALDPAKLKGAIIVTPVSNPLAFSARQKNTPQDGLDLDMQFPGNPKGTISQRIAHFLFEQIKLHATHLIDAHTVGTHYQSRPYTVFKRLADEAQSQTYAEAEKLARTFGGYAHCRVDFSQPLYELPGNVNGFLDVQALLHGIPACMVEVGAGGVLEKADVDWAERGFRAVFRELGLYEDAVPPHPEHQPVTITERRFLYSDAAGIAVDNPAPGTVVKRGERLVTVIDLLGNEQPILAEEDMYIILSRRNPVVDVGDRIAFVGTKWES